MLTVMICGYSERMKVANLSRVVFFMRPDIHNAPKIPSLKGRGDRLRWVSSPPAQSHFLHAPGRPFLNIPHSPLPHPSEKNAQSPIAKFSRMVYNG